MNTWQSRTAAAAAVILALGGGATAIAQAAPPTNPTPGPVATSTATVDAAVAEQIAFMRDEERMSRDVYLAIAELYPDATAFSRIASSEERHFDAVGRLLTRYGLDDPSEGRDAGSYADASLTDFHDQLMAQAKVSVDEAYKAGVAIEEADIADLEADLDGDLPADVEAVWTNLLAGSNNHLAAFTALRDGEVLGAQDGTGAQNGNRANRGQGSGRPSDDGAAMGQGQRGGERGGQGAGRDGSTFRQGDCRFS